MRLEEKCTSVFDEELLSDEESLMDYSNEETTEDKISYYRSMTKRKSLFDLMMSVYATYITPERLLECLHPFDTQLNEALNNVVAQYAPKNRT